MAEEKSEFMKWWEAEAIPTLKASLMIENEENEDFPPFNKLPLNKERADDIQARIEEINKAYATPMEDLAKVIKLDKTEDN